MKKSKLNLKVATSRLLLLLFILVLPDLVSAQIEYVPLIETGLQTGEGFGDFINNLYYLSIGLAALLAVIKIVIAGVKWMLSGIVTEKTQAKKDIQGSLIGLIIIISAVLVLNIINPSLVNLKATTSDVTGYSDSTDQAADNDASYKSTIPCWESTDISACDAAIELCKSAGGSPEKGQQGESQIIVCSLVDYSLDTDNDDSTDQTADSSTYFDCSKEIDGELMSPITGELETKYKIDCEAATVRCTDLGRTPTPAAVDGTKILCSKA